jgi:hypothetical protein
MVLVIFKPEFTHKVYTQHAPRHPVEHGGGEGEDEQVGEGLQERRVQNGIKHVTCTDRGGDKVTTRWTRDNKAEQFGSDGIHYGTYTLTTSMY